MPLMMLDLDNTLIDRDRAFRRWAESFVRSHRGSSADVAWLVEADRDGYEPREQLAARIGQRFELGATVEVAEELRRGMVAQIELDPAVPRALSHARRAGWSLVVVTNGSVTQQEHKLRATTLDSRVDGWVISEGVGLRKPDPKIFSAAADLVGESLTRSWVIGDSAAHDVAGAHAVGARNAWIHRGRVWPAPERPPTLFVDSAAEAVRQILDGSADAR